VRCSSCEPLLDAHLEGTLRRYESLKVAAHLRGCAGCAALLGELRVIDALLTTARPPRVAADFTASVVSATHATRPQPPRRSPMLAALLTYVGIAWAIAAFVALQFRNVAGVAETLLALEERNLAALGAAVRALAPAAPVAAAAVTVILLIDLLLLGAMFFGYRRVRPLIALYLRKEPRP
jgi:anti-sigma factor RsiW